MRSSVSNERGAIMVVESILLLAVLGVVGYAGLHVYHAHHTTNHPTATVTTIPPPTTSGPVDRAVNAAIQAATTESTSAAGDNSETSQVTANASSESNITGAYDENSF